MPSFLYSMMDERGKVRESAKKQNSTLTHDRPVGMVKLQISLACNFLDLDIVRNTASFIPCILLIYQWRHGLFHEKLNLHRYHRENDSSLHLVVKRAQVAFIDNIYLQSRSSPTTTFDFDNMHYHKLGCCIQSNSS